MRFTSITAALALLAASVSALEKPLDIEVVHSTECTRKSARGKVYLSTAHVVHVLK